MLEDLSRKEKVAILLLNIGAEAAGDILGNFAEGEIQEISRIITKMRNIDEATSIAVLNEFNNHFDSWRKSEELIDVIKDYKPNIIPFAYFENLTNDEIMSIIAGEHPQLIALVLSYLDSKKSAAIVSIMPEEMRADVINRMAIATAPPIQIIKQIDERLESKVISLGDRMDTPNERKYRTIAEILNRTDSLTEKTIMQRIKEDSPEIAKEIKSLMFVFEDIEYVTEQALRKVLSEVNSTTIAMSLKTAGPAVRDKIFGNMSKRMGGMVREEQELLGPRPLAEVEMAQKEIIDVFSKLEAQGEMVRGKVQDQGPMV